MSDWPLILRDGYAELTVTVRMPEHIWRSKPGDRIVTEVVSVTVAPYSQDRDVHR